MESYESFHREICLALPPLCILRFSLVGHLSPSWDPNHKHHGNLRFPQLYRLSKLF
jgi:hypothetical protein